MLQGSCAERSRVAGCGVECFVCSFSPRSNSTRMDGCTKDNFTEERIETRTCPLGCESVAVYDLNGNTTSVTARTTPLARPLLVLQLFLRGFACPAPYCPLYGYHLTCCLAAYLLFTCLPACPPAFTLRSVLMQDVSLLQRVAFSFFFLPSCALFTALSSAMAALPAVCLLPPLCVPFRCLPQRLL